MNKLLKPLLAACAWRPWPRLAGAQQRAYAPGEPAQPVLQRPGPGDQPGIHGAIRRPPHPGRPVALLSRPGEPLELGLQPDQGGTSPSRWAVTAARPHGRRHDPLRKHDNDRAQTCRDPVAAAIASWCGKLSSAPCDRRPHLAVAATARSASANGCRGEFAAADRCAASAGGRAVRCESNDNQVAAPARSPWRGRRGCRAQLSKAGLHREGRSLAVAAMARSASTQRLPGRIRLGRGGGGGRGGGSGYIVTCASSNDRCTYLHLAAGPAAAAPAAAAVAPPCMQGRTWGMAGQSRSGSTAAAAGASAMTAATERGS